MPKQSISQLSAVGLALAGYTCWVLADTSLKIIGNSRLPVFEVVGLVGFAIAALLLVGGAARRDLRALVPRSPGRQLLRSLLDLANNVCVVIALRHLPLALFYILVFLAPVVTTLLAAVFLRETLEWRRSLAILAGFAGVLVAVNPFGAGRPGDLVGIAACMVCVLAFSVSMVWSRTLTQTETSESLTFTSGVLMAIVGGLATLGHAGPVTLPIAGVVAAAGLFCVLGSLCFFVALRHAAAATVSQYHYSQLLTGALLAYLIWGETLSVSMMLGAVLIIGAGWYTAALSSSPGAYVAPAERLAP